MNKMNSFELSFSSSSKKILVNQVEFQNDISYICLSIFYLQQCNDYSYSKQECPRPVSYGYAQPLPSSGPSFDPCFTLFDLTDVYFPVIDPLDDPHFVLDPDFIGEQDWSLLFDVNKKVEKYLELEMSWRP